MKNTICIFILCFFAFAKTSIAAVPTATKSLGIEHPKDSLLLFTVESKNQEDAEKEIAKLLKSSRKLANIAFVCIAIFLLGVIFAVIEVYFLAITFVLSAPIAGLFLSIGSVLKLIKIRRLLNDFPTLEADEERMERFASTMRISAIAAILYSLGVFVFTTFAFTDGDIFTGNLPSITTTAGLGFILFCIFDALSFKTKNKVKK
jgi:uncharacterized protein YqhQ